MDYSKYKFNYFDVVKRHERIINRPKDWEIKVLACIMLFVTFCYVFSSGVFATEEWETVETNTVTGIAASDSYNYFYATQSGPGIKYFPVEIGYIYKITINQSMTGGRYVVGTSEIPALNVTYDILTSGLQTEGQTYSFICNNNSYAFLSISPYASTSYILVERQKIVGQSSAISDLVDNVGVNQMWGIFENGIDFVGVVVLVAFGLFLVVLAIKKVSKGKSDY